MSAARTKFEGRRGALTPQSATPKREALQKRRATPKRGGGTPPPFVAPSGIKPPPAHAPRRLATTADLKKLQRLMTHALLRPLTARDGMQKKWIDGRPMADVADEFIKSNDRLTSFERLQLYNRMYWFRVLDIMHEDNQALRALLGPKKFTRFIEAYLAKYPSRSFTLRNLCRRLAKFIREQPTLTSPHTALAYDVARFEWAQTVAFDGEQRPVIAPSEIAARPPARLRLSLQPYLSLLRFDYPVDNYVLAVKKREALRTEASHAIESSARVNEATSKVPRPKRQRIYLAAHRLDNLLYYKRLERPAFLMLEALRAGRPLAAAVTAGGPRVTAKEVQTWFSTWMELGWLCPR